MEFFYSYALPSALGELSGQDCGEAQMRQTFILGMLITLAGCNPITDVANQPTDQLCQYYQASRAAIRGTPAELRAELEKRGAINPTEWPAINTGAVHYGMNKCAIEAIGGRPITDSHAMSAKGEVEILVYELAVITLQNDKVVAYTVPGNLPTSNGLGPFHAPGE
jgi:hypothetical protein